MATSGLLYCVVLCCVYCLVSQVHVLMNRGLIAMSTDQYTTAVDYFSAIVDIDPTVWLCVVVECDPHCV